jgi:hypothetical protein
LNHGLDIGANSIGASTNFTIGVAANPGVPDIEHELRRFAYKVEAGAEYAITQPVFDLRLLESFSSASKDHRIPVIAGIWPLTSLRNAEFMKNDLRVSMPEEIMLRMAQADTPDAARREGILIAQEMLEAVRPFVQGVQVSAPFGRYTAAAEVIAIACGVVIGLLRSPRFIERVGFQNTLLGFCALIILLSSPFPIWSLNWWRKHASLTSDDEEFQSDRSMVRSTGTTALSFLVAFASLFCLVLFLKARHG